MIIIKIIIDYSIIIELSLNIDSIINQWLNIHWNSMIIRRDLRSREVISGPTSPTFGGWWDRRSYHLMCDAHMHVCSCRTFGPVRWPHSTRLGVGYKYAAATRVELTLVGLVGPIQPKIRLVGTNFSPGWVQVGPNFH